MTAVNHWLRSAYSLLTPVRKPVQLPSSCSDLLFVPKVNTSIGTKTFAVGGTLWNMLPPSVKSVENIAKFHRHLKTYFAKKNNLMTIGFVYWLRDWSILLFWCASELGLKGFRPNRSYLIIIILVSLTDRCPSLTDRCPSLTDRCPSLTDRCPSLTDRCPSLTDRCPSLTDRCPSLTDSCHSPLVSASNVPVGHQTLH